MALSFFQRQMIGTFLPMLPDALSQIDSIVTKSISELQLLENEISAAYVLVAGKDGKAYIVTAFFDENDKIIRTGNQLLATDFIQQLVQQSL